jgi:hypothetical protein
VRIRRFPELPALAGMVGTITTPVHVTKEGTIDKRGFVTVLIRDRSFTIRLNLPWSDIEVVTPESAKSRKRSRGDSAGSHLLH